MIQLIRGFKDILPGEVELWQKIEKTARELFEDFGFNEIRIPIIERTELFARSIGEETDIVQKEMYTFPDRKGELVTLRPEATASIVRSYIQHKMYAIDPVRKLYVIGPMFRRERPQKGRYRQFYQIDAEILGVASPLIDVQLIFMLVKLFSRLRVENAHPHINSLGCPECRPGFKTDLATFLTDRSDRLCGDCVRRSTTNPLRVLDCKVPSCQEAIQGAPSILDWLCDACRADFDTVKTMLEEMGITYVVNPRLVRGLDYYTRTAFEIQTGELGAQNAVAGGGRYDGLVRLLGGPDQPATGFAIGFDRLAEVSGYRPEDLVRSPDLYIAALGARSRSAAFVWHCEMSLEGIRSEMDFQDRSLKSQMKRADRVGAQHVLIVGDAELEKGAVILRDMKTQEQSTIAIGEVVDRMGKLICR